jgi:hypothetical protein
MSFKKTIAFAQKYLLQRESHESREGRTSKSSKPSLKPLHFYQIFSNEPPKNNCKECSPKNQSTFCRNLARRKRKRKVAPTTCAIL